MAQKTQSVFLIQDIMNRKKYTKTFTKIENFQCIQLMSMQFVNKNCLRAKLTFKT